MEKFSTGFAGYRKDEVNRFVNDVINQVETIISELKTKDVEIEKLHKELEHYKNMEATFNRALLVAEDASNQIKRIARDEGASIINEAKRNASRIVNEALVQAEKSKLENEQIKRNITSLKRRLRSILESHLDLVEDMERIDL
jgi:cell division initiation protein